MELRNNLKWNWPILTKIKKVYKEKGLFKTILWILIIFLGIKIVFLNLIIFLLNNIFSIQINYAPVLTYLLSN